MGFTVRFMLGTVLVLLCFWSIQTTPLNRSVRQVSENGNNQTTEKLQEAQTENRTQSVVANLTEDDNNKPKTDFSIDHNTTIDKQNSVVGKLQKSESFKKAVPQAEIGRSIDIEKFVSKDFHNKNNVYTVPVSPDTEKYIDPDFNFHATTHKHSDFVHHFDFDAELTTPKSTLFDQKYKEAVDSIEQKLEHIDDSHELSSESESKESINLDKLYDETQKNDTKANLNYINYKNIVSNDTGSKNSLHKDLVVEAGTNLHFRSFYNHTTVTDEDDSGNNTIVKDPDDEKKVESSTLSNLIPAKGDLDIAESSTSKSIILTTRKSFTLTKPPSNKNSSHISILSNNIETETLKAVNPVVTTTARPKGETEIVPETLSKGTPIEVGKRLFTFNDVPRTESTIDTNHISKKSEQLLQENQVIPVHVEPPPSMRNTTTEATPSEDISRVMEMPPKSVVPLKGQLNQSVETLTPKTIISNEEKDFEKNNISVNTEFSITTNVPQEMITTNVPEVKITSFSEGSTEPVILKKVENETTLLTKQEATTFSSEPDTEVSTLDLGSTSMSSNIEITTILPSKQETTTILPSKQETTTILPSKQETTTILSSRQETTTISSSQPEVTIISSSQPEVTTPSILEPETTTVFPKSETVTSETTTTLPTKFKEIINATKETEVETITSIVTETSISPWQKVTVQTTNIDIQTTSSPQYETESTTVIESEPTTVIETESSTIEIELSTVSEESENTTFASTYLSDSTAATATETSENSITTLKEETTTEVVFKKDSESEVGKNTMTTENTVRTSKEMVYKNITTPSTFVITEEVTTVKSSETTLLETTTEKVIETTTKQIKVEEPEPTAGVVTHTPGVPEFKHIEHTDYSVDIKNTTEYNAMASDFYEHSTNNTDPPEDNSGTIAAITISSIGAVCLILLAGLLVIMRKRQKRFNYGQRCTPVSLDDYSMDNVSVYNSVRRKGMLRGSKRSYGNPAFEDPVCVSHPLNFPALGKFATNLEDIKAEFEEIPQITARTNELPEGCDTKNRYANVIPLPETRVFLSLIDGYPNSDYINANYVTGPKNTKGYYIACQAPLQNTVDDFWRMIWEQQCKVVLMLTHLFENGVEKCVDYLPPSEVLDCHRLFGDFQVTLKKREVKDKYIISSLQLKNMVSNSWREVTHFWYLGWPEKGVPLEANSLIAFLIEARSYMKSSSLDRKEVTNGNLTNGMTKNELNPVVVHCSPGTGRTGVVIACDIAIREFEQTRLIDVPRIVYKIRRDRASAVQTKEQYAFIYKVINLYATKLTGGALDSL